MANNIDLSKVKWDEPAAGGIDLSQVKWDNPGEQENPAFLPDSNRVKAEIAQRPDSVKTFMDESNTRWNPAVNPVKAALHYPTSAMKMAAIPFQRAEAAVANPALEMQAGNFNPIKLAGEAIKGASGQKAGQLGDLVRTTGFGKNVPSLIGGNANEMLAGTVGLPANVALGNAAARGVIKGAPAAAKAISNFGKLTEDQVNLKIAEEINKGVRQGIRPSSTGERTRSDFAAKKFTSDSASAVKDIVQNKGVLEFTDDTGNVVKGQLPENLKETASAMNQRMKTLADEWTTLAKKSGADGNVIETKPMVKKLNAMLDDEVFMTEHPGDYAKVKSIRDGLVLRGKMKPTEALDKVQEWNADLKGNYKTGFKYGSNRAANVVKEMNDELRDNLSTVIENSTGKEFQALRSQWGAYKSLIKDVQHRVNVSGRQSPKGIWSFLDAAGNAEIMGGAGATITGAPQVGLPMMFKGAALKVGRRIIGKANDPNEIVKNMFSRVDGLMQKLPKKQVAPNVAAVQQPPQQILGLPAPLPKYLQERQNIPPLDIPRGNAVSSNPIPMSGAKAPLGLPRPTPKYLLDRQNIPAIKNPVGEAKFTPPDVIPMGNQSNPTLNNPITDFNPIKAQSKGVKSKVGMAGAAALGMGVSASQAEAGQNIDIKKINMIESSGNPKAIGDNGKAFGINQIHKGTLSDYNKANKTNLTTDDLMTRATNDKVADWYFNKEIPRLLKHFKHPDAVKNRIIAYNAGISRVGKSVLPKTTYDYINKYNK